MMLHDTIDTEMKKLGHDTWLADIVKENGEVTVYDLLILSDISLTTFAPYELWKKCCFKFMP